MTSELGFKDLYSVSLKTTSSIVVGSRTIEPGETIAFFDKIQIANFQEIKNNASARGGFDNRSHVFWDSTKEIKINFSQGVFSKIQLALMTNAKLITDCGKEVVMINENVAFESDENGEISFKKAPRGPIFVYDATSGEKITDWVRMEDKINVKAPYKTVVIDYWYEYSNGYTKLQVGKPLTTGYFSLTGKMRVKDDVTGKVKTGIISIPKLRLMSDLSMRVGSDATPQVGQLDAIAVPEGARGQSKVMEIIFLNDDIDADM